VAKKMANFKMPSTQTLKDWGEQLQSSVVLGIKVFIVLLFLVLLPYMIMELFRNYLIIQPFEVPVELAEKQGYSGKVVAHRLQGYMDNKREELERSSMLGVYQGMAAVQSAEFATKRQAIDVATLGFSLNSIISQIRWLLGLPQHQVNGDLVIRDNKLHLTIRITGKLPTTFSGKYGDVKNPEQVIEKAAEYVLKTVEPLLLGNNYCLNRKDDLLEVLIDDIQQNKQSGEDQVVALTLESCLLKNMGKFEKALVKVAQAKKLEPANPLIFLMEGNLFLDADEPTEAIVAYKTALKHDPNNGGIYTKLAEAYIKTGKIQKALAQYKRAAKKAPRNPSIYTNWGEQLTKSAIRDLANDDADAATANFDKAEAKFKQALQVAPSYALAYGAWGNALFQKKDYQAASEKYEKAVKLDPTISWFYGNWGVVLVNLKESEKALDKFANSLMLRQEMWVYIELVRALKRVKNPDLFARYKEVALKMGRLASYYDKWGAVLANLERYEEALVKYEDALNLKHKKAVYNKLLNTLKKLNKHEYFAQYEAVALKLGRGASYYDKWGTVLDSLERYEDALVKYQKALEMKQDDGFYNNLLDTLKTLNKPESFAQYKPLIEKRNKNNLKKRYYYAYGRALAARGQYEQAIAKFNKALEADSTYVWGRIRLSYALIKVQKPEEAMTQCEDALKSSSASNAAKAAAHALCGLAQIGLNQPEKAVESCQTALKLSEKEDWAYWCLGDVLILQGKLDEAVKRYEKAVKLKPKTAFYYYERAFYYYKWGQAFAELQQYDAAITQYQQAVELDKAGEIGKQARANIEALKEKSTSSEEQPIDVPKTEIDKAEDALPESSTPSDKAAEVPPEGSTPSDKAAEVPPEGSTPSDKAAEVQSEGLTPSDKAAEAAPEGLTPSNKAEEMPSESLTP
jgi:tetratricopeptide (TPR) repeat protein